jgi:hypothetical protein
LLESALPAILDNGLALRPLPQKASQARGCTRRLWAIQSCPNAVEQRLIIKRFGQEFHRA